MCSTSRPTANGDKGTPGVALYGFDKTYDDRLEVDETEAGLGPAGGPPIIEGVSLGKIAARLADAGTPIPCRCTKRWKYGGILTLLLDPHDVAPPTRSRPRRARRRRGNRSSPASGATSARRAVGSSSVDLDRAAAGTDVGHRHVRQVLGAAAAAHPRRQAQACCAQTDRFPTACCGVSIIAETFEAHVNKTVSELVDRRGAPPSPIARPGRRSRWTAPPPSCRRRGSASPTVVV